MTIELTQRADLGWVEIVRARNDCFRETLVRGCVVLSAGVVALGASGQALILESLQAFDDFDDEDSFDLHDIGDFAVGGISQDGTVWRELIFFRIEDRDGLVLSVKLASEW